MTIYDHVPKLYCSLDQSNWRKQSYLFILLPKLNIFILTINFCIMFSLSCLCSKNTRFFYKKNFYQKITLKNPKALRKGWENLQLLMPELQFLKTLIFPRALSKLQNWVNFSIFGVKLDAHVNIHFRKWYWSLVLNLPK